MTIADGGYLSSPVCRPTGIYVTAPAEIIYGTSLRPIHNDVSLSAGRDGDRQFEDTATRPRPNRESAVTGAVGTRVLCGHQTGRVRVKEADDRSFAVVVERGVRAAFRVDAVPLLPDSGRAALQHRHPGWFALAEEQLVREAEESVVGRRGQ